MNDEMERSSLDLEEIIKEFSDHSHESEQEETVTEEVTEEVTEAVAEEIAEEVTEEVTEAVAEEPAEETEEMEKTRRIDRSELHKAQQKEDLSQETRRIDPVRMWKKAAPTSDDTIPFEAVRSQLSEMMEEPETEDVAKIWNPGETPKAEEFTERWEPEYEQPMGEYVPPQPIQFQPRSRLNELKKKLVAGPEKRFYQLSEVGVSKLQSVIFLSVLVVLIAAASTVMYATGVIPEHRVKVMVFCQFITLLFAGLLGSYQLIEGVADLCKKRFTPNTLLVVTFVVCIVDGIFCLDQVRVPCSAAFSLAVCMSLWSTYQRRSAEISQMDTMRKAVRLDGIAACPDYMDGKKGLLQKEGQVEDFMDTYAEPGKPEKALNVYALVAMFVAFAIGITAAVLKYLTAGVLEGVTAGLQVCAVCLLAAMPATIFISQSRPAWVLERRLHRLGTVLCGWQGVEGLRGEAVYPVTGMDLYPPDTLRMNGMKFFDEREPEQVIAYATAVISATECGFAHLFTGLLDSYNGVHFAAKDITFYENGGMTGVVEGEAVALGSWSFMKEMEIEVPDSARISYGMYIAIGGELSGVFAVNYGKNPSSAAGVNTLTAYKNLECVLVTDDFVVTEGFLKGKFGIKNKRFILPEYAQRAALRQKELPEEAPTLLMSTALGLAPLAYGVTGARVLRNSSWAGAILHIVGGAVGLAMMLVLVILGALYLISPLNMFLYQLIWMIPALLITEWTRIV
ncbi:MAG: hypothetical protein IJ403_03660 [Oscillospiraceae bacterium]|nr:hypothetical protein [Oscillospiraceae bacterium]